MGIMAGFSTGAMGSLIKSCKGNPSRTEKISKDEMIQKIDSLFLQNSTEEYRVSVIKIFSPWQKGNSVDTTDGKYKLKTFIFGAFSKWANLRVSRIWIYDNETNVCYECKAWSVKKIVKFVKSKK